MGVAHKKSLKKSHSCCPCLSNSNPHCENTQTNSALLCPLGKNLSQHTHTHTFTHLVHTNQHYIHWGKTPTWTYIRIHTYGTHKSALLPLGKKNLLGHTHVFTLMVHTNQHCFHWGKKHLLGHTYVFTLMVHTNQHCFHWGKNLRGHTHIHTYGTHTSICEPSETPTENSSAKTQRRRKTVVDLKALVE